MKKIMTLLLLFSVLSEAEKPEKDSNPDMNGISSSYEMKRHVIASGGDTVGSGAYKLSSTLGQSFAHDEVVSGNYSLRGGFWHTTHDLIFKDGFD